MNETERVEEAVIHTLNQGEYPSGSRIAKRMGVRSLNGRKNDARVAFLERLGFQRVLHGDSARYELTP